MLIGIFVFFDSCCRHSRKLALSYRVCKEGVALPKLWVSDAASIIASFLFTPSYYLFMLVRSFSATSQWHFAFFLFFSPKKEKKNSFNISLIYSSVFSITKAGRDFTLDAPRNYCYTRRYNGHLLLDEKVTRWKVLQGFKEIFFLRLNILNYLRVELECRLKFVPVRGKSSFLKRCGSFAARFNTDSKKRKKHIFSCERK